MGRKKQQQQKEAEEKRAAKAAGGGGGEAAQQPQPAAAEAKKAEPASSKAPCPAAPWAAVPDTYEAFVRQSTLDMDRDLRYFDANVLDDICRRFPGDCHDVFQSFRSDIHEAFSSEASLADLQFDLKRAWLAGLLQHCDQPKRQKDASDMLDQIQSQKGLGAKLSRRKAAMEAANVKDFDESSKSILAVLDSVRALHEGLLAANAQFPGTVPEADLQHLERWEEQRESLEQRARSRGHSVAVVGLEKTGKSTACNALVGLRLLPAAVERCTMLTTRIRPAVDGKYRMEVTFTDEAAFEMALAHARDVFDRKQRELEESRAANDPEYQAPARENRPRFDATGVRLKCQSLVGGEPETIEGRDEIGEALQRYTANIDTMLAVRTVTVWTPELSADNMEIVDVPGFDSPLAEHREAASRSLNESDAFLFVTNGAANVDLTAPALELMRTIRKVAPQALDKGYALVTHLDACSSRAEFADRRTKAVRRLVELGFNESRIFCACPPLALMEREREAGDANASVGETGEHYGEMAARARRYGLDDGFAQLRSSLEEFVTNDLPLRRRREALTLSRLTERSCSAAMLRLVEQLRTYLPPDQSDQLSAAESKLDADTASRLLDSIETGIARTHNSQWSRIWTEIWAHVNSSAADWLAANYFDRFDELSAEWTGVFREHYNAGKDVHTRELYDKFKSRLSVLPMVLEEPDPCDAEMAHRVWLVDAVHRTLTSGAARVARRVYEVLDRYFNHLSRTCFARFTDDVEHLGITLAPLAVTESAVRLKIEFNTLQAARLLEKRVLRYPSWHPRRVVRELAKPIPGLYDAPVAPAAAAPAAGGEAKSSPLEGAVAGPDGFPRSAASEEKGEDGGAGGGQVSADGGAAMTNADRNDVRALEGGLAVTKLPNSRKGSVHSTRLMLSTLETGERVVTYESKKKFANDICIPVASLKLVEGPVTDGFNRLSAKKKAESADRSLSLQGDNGRHIDVVCESTEQYERVVRGLRAAAAAERATTGGTGPAAVAAAGNGQQAAAVPVQ